MQLNSRDAWIKRHEKSVRIFIFPLPGEARRFVIILYALSRPSNVFYQITMKRTNIGDPSDWVDTKVPEIADLDGALRCQICKELLQAPVLTTCGHVFCSICIRRNLTVSQNCPLCHEETYESGLRKILLLDGIVTWFEQHRVQLQNALKVDTVDDSQSEGETGNDNEALCPVCGKRMPLQELQGRHIDQCLAAPSPPPTATAKMQIQTNGTNKPRLPNLDTSMSTVKLREKMSALRLPTHGTRSQLERRIKEYINLHNANLDALNPVSEFTLLSRLRQWESVVGSPSTVQPERNMKRQKIEHKRWNKEHSAEYKSLIEQARARSKKK
ncbi:hypothetical protein CANINC_004686 [Pichia inconspicua]|uniref:Postreplication repair E3 ubiquitin-protein ligase RAD18 n=1 Tax=Pichia inconspicua TaxID=52247 RepID=A0A4T0WW34_9ASCO|nr:hypothetical protein CANINC_004686 [[Candida] inconspicua]